jgi:hypothetical protein
VVNDGIDAMTGKAGTFLYARAYSNFPEYPVIPSIPSWAPSPPLDNAAAKPTLTPLEDAALLAEVQCLFSAKEVEAMPGAEGKRLWRERLARQREAIARGARGVPLYMWPWPASLTGLGPRTVHPLSPCADCGGGTWCSYGARPLCLACARQRGRQG